jgi:hypothetical protein
MSTVRELGATPVVNTDGPPSPVDGGPMRPMWHGVAVSSARLSGWDCLFAKQEEWA